MLPVEKYLQFYHCVVFWMIEGRVVSNKIHVFLKSNVHFQVMRPIVAASTLTIAASTVMSTLFGVSIYEEWYRFVFIG